MVCQAILRRLWPTNSLTRNSVHAMLWRMPKSSRGCFTPGTLVIATLITLPSISYFFWIVEECAYQWLCQFIPNIVLYLTSITFKRPWKHCLWLSYCYNYLDRNRYIPNEKVKKKKKKKNPQKNPRRRNDVIQAEFETRRWCFQVLLELLELSHSQEVKRLKVAAIKVTAESVTQYLCIVEVKSVLFFNNRKCISALKIINFDYFLPFTRGQRIARKRNSSCNFR